HRAGPALVRRALHDGLVRLEGWLQGLPGRAAVRGVAIPSTLGGRNGESDRLVDDVRRARVRPSPWGRDGPLRRGSPRRDSRRHPADPAGPDGESAALPDAAL